MDSLVTFNSECVRKKSNWSKTSNKYKLDNEDFNPLLFREDISKNSPKLKALLDKIETLDKSDMETDGTLYKHFIFCDLKSGNYGAKMLASAFQAMGMTMGYSATLKKGKPSKSTKVNMRAKKFGTRKNGSLSKRMRNVPRKMVPKLSTIQEEDEDEDEEEDSEFKGGAKLFNKIEFLDKTSLAKTKNNNFYLLSSVAVFDQPISVANKKHILQMFNERPDNVYGENVRFIIMDSGFKEGIDLFDIKYVHIFEPPVNAADQKQVIGRGTRTCGQKGLTFHPTKGWPLYVFIYDLEIPDKLKPSFLGASSAYELYLKSINFDLRLFEFSNDVEELATFGSVDHELNQNIHNFSLTSGGGGGPKKKRIVIVKEFPDEKLGSVLFDKSRAEFGFNEMRAYISRNFSDTAWEPAKMENLCEEKKGGGIIQYSPTQEFVRRYFSPAAPVKGMLLWHSVGTGKTCSAIAAATSSFEPEGYTILWVTRTTLKNDIWKNMFDQICSETIKKRILEEGLDIPKDQAKRMKLLSKSWKIRPMSYKQFSNLVSKENNFYKTLVGINGTEDPLRKTLLIIDEAHKLYGGGDLSSIERPDMNALHKALMNSYRISGDDSARLLLMTATPITENAMELIKLVNLCKPAAQQIPDDFASFSQDYLNENGRFTEEGKGHFLDKIAGHISYLNREKDARQFSQPVIKKIMTPIIPDIQDALSTDKRFARGYYNEEIDILKKRILDQNSAIDSDLKDLDASRFYELKDKCDELEGPLRKKCLKIANANIRELVKEAKAHTKEIKEGIKEIRGEIKNKRLFNKDVLKEVSDRIDANPELLEEFKKTTFYQMKYKCSKKIKAKKNEDLDQNPAVNEINQEIEDYNARAQALTNGFEDNLKAHQNRIKRITRTMRSNITPLERSVLKLVLTDARKTHKLGLKAKKKALASELKDVNSTRKELEKRLKKERSKIRKTVKKQDKEKKALERDTEKAEKKLRKTLRKQGELKEEIKNDLLKGLVVKYSEAMDSDLGNLEKAILEKEELVKEKAKEKIKAKEEKVKEKAKIKEEKAKEKAKIKEEKALEKAEAKERTRKEKEDAKKEKEAARKTKKNQK